MIFVTNRVRGEKPVGVEILFRLLAGEIYLELKAEPKLLTKDKRSQISWKKGKEHSNSNLVNILTL